MAMDINDAIAQLKDFKKAAKTLDGKIEVVSLSDDSFVFKVSGKKCKEEPRTVVTGFCPRG